MKVHGLTWLGTRTPRFEEMVEFAEQRLGLRANVREEGMAFFQLEDGSLFEVFAADRPAGGHPAEGVVAGFHVDDVEAAHGELEQAGVEVSAIGSSGPGAWFYFIAPDGNCYELNGPAPG
jgi:catechol 2,3-dioxygenase-like lactoylglutathione lyase family enzyme